VTDHMKIVGHLYNKGDKEGEDAGTTLQTVTINEPNKNGVRESAQYVKCKRGKPKPGQDPITYYRVKGGKDVRDMLDQIQKNGEREGKDGVDYEKVKKKRPNTKIGQNIRRCKINAKNLLFHKYCQRRRKREERKTIWRW